MIFQKYLSQVADAYMKSDIHKRQPAYSYSLCSTPLNKGAIVICGFNWGGNGHHEPQTIYPTVRFPEVKELGSMRRIVGYLKLHYSEDDLNNVVQINVCFFRSQYKREISIRDINLCTPIFYDLLCELEPKVVVGLSTAVPEVLNELVTEVDSVIVHKQNRSNRYSKYEFKNNQQFKLVHLPHPNYPLAAEERQRVWSWGLQK